MEVINKEKYNVPVFSWCPEIEENAMKQVETVAALPFLHKRICVMPDCHMGYGMPIGGVVALKNVISPNMVGVDIGCGMCAVKTSLTEIDIETLKKIMGEIRKAIPVGFNKHKEKQDDILLPFGIEGHEDDCNPEEGYEEIIDDMIEQNPTMSRTEALQELRDKYLEQCKLFANEAKKLNCPVSLRGKYYPNSGYAKDINTVVFLTSRRRQGKHYPEKYTVKI